MKRVLPFAIIIGVLATALAIGWRLTRPAPQPREAPPVTPANTRSGSTKLGADPPHALGSTDAPVMLEEFGDFECQVCGVLHPVLKTMKQEFGPRLVIVFRELPLQTVHPHALAAARAAEAAGLQGKFWEMHDQLYDNQKSWHDASDAGPMFEQYATRIGLDLDRFKRDINSETLDRRVLLDRERAGWIGVTGTPAVFLNGHEVPMGSLAPDKLRALIDAEPRN